MAALVLYIDDSIQGFIYSLGAYIAPLEAWRVLEAKWRAAIAGAPHRIREWKTSDCRHGNGEFSSKDHGWTKQQRDEFTRQIISIVRDTGAHRDMIGMAGITLMNGNIFTNTEADRIRFEQTGFKSSVYQLATLIFGVVQFMFGNDDHEVAIVFDKGKLRGWTAHTFSELFSRYGNTFGSVVFDDSCEHPGLQAADLIAYEAGKESINRHIEPRRPSRALQALVDSHPHFATVSDWVSLHKMVMAKDTSAVVDHARQHPLMFAWQRPLRDSGLWGANPTCPAVSFFDAAYLSRISAPPQSSANASGSESSL